MSGALLGKICIYCLSTTKYACCLGEEPRVKRKTSRREEKKGCANSVKGECKKKDTYETYRADENGLHGGAMEREMFGA